MQFTHKPLHKIELSREDRPTGRVYVTPEGNCWPSVTRVINFEPNPALEKWKAMVGEEEAKAVCARAAVRGAIIHSYAEDYLNNKSPNVSMFDIDLWKKYRLLLNRVNMIHLLEGKLYSDKLRLAGTVDCVGEYDGVLSIIDFKTSLRLKTEEDIFNYFLQTTAYAAMVYERYGLVIKQIVILIAVDNEDPQIFVKKVGPYLVPLYDVIKRFEAHNAMNS